MTALRLDEITGQSIERAKAETSNDIRNAKENFNAGQIFNSGCSSTAYVRSIRSSALDHFKPAKLEIFQNTIDRLIHESNTHGLRVLRDLSERISTQETKKKKAQQEKERLQEDFTTLSTFEKFSLYGDVNITQKQDISDTPVSSAILQEKKDYKVRRLKSRVLGSLISLLCALMDYNIINNVFLISNMSWRDAFTMAVFSAIALDIPPYLLGSVWQKKADQQQFWNLRGQQESKTANEDMRLHTIKFRILLVVIVLFFAMYLGLRLLLFLGGGDFDLALHFLLNWEFHFEEVQFSSADWISILFPIVTSVVAFIIGSSQYVSRTDHIEKMVAIINKNLQLQIKECCETIIECEIAEESLLDELAVTKCEIWTFYFGQRDMPEQDAEFRQRVTAEFQRLNLGLYLDTYRNCCIQLRTEAESILSQINLELVACVANQAEISEMGILDTEQDTLNEFWVMEQDGVQHKSTLDNIKKIQDLIAELAKTF